MRSLAQFSTYQEVFKNSTNLPAFFDSNLVDPGRVVKAFYNDPQAHIRIFYYQYLRLCFELQTPKSQSYVRKLQDLINNPTFQLIFYQDDDPNIYNDTNAKSLISQFFEVLVQGEQTILQAINNNPIMDVILVHFFRTLLILTNQAQTLDNYIPKETLIENICNFFGVDVQFHGECCHYVESDIFVYEENEAAVFMAYISPYDMSNNYETEIVQSKEEIPTNYQEPEPNYVQPSYQAPLPTLSLAYAEPPKPTIKAPSERLQNGKESYIASEFVDYTYGVEPLQNKVKVNLKGSGTNINSFINATSEVKPSTNQYTSSNVENLSIPSSASKQLFFIETASISSGSDNKNFTQNIGHVATQPDYMMRSNPVTRGNVTHLQFEQIPASSSGFPIQAKPLTPSPQSGYQPPAPQPIPTKDYNISTSPSPVSQYGIQNSYFSSSKVETVLPPKPSSSNLSDSKKDIFYNPKVESSSFNQYVSNYTPSTSTYDYKSPVSQSIAPIAGNPLAKNKNFGINVSEEFTSEQTMKAMNEPYKSNVQGMKSRVRNFRASLANYNK